MIACCLLCPASLAACGEDEGLGGVEADRALGSLSGDEWQAVCKDVHARVEDGLESEDLQRGVCLATLRVFSSFGTAAAAQAATCELEVPRCIAGELESSNVFGRCAKTPPKSCDLSNAQLERCVRVQLDALEELGADLSCSELAANDGQVPWPDDVVSACKGLDERCRGLFAGIDRPDRGPGQALDGGVDLDDWEEKIREHVESLMAVNCKASPERSKSLDQLATALALDWDTKVEVARTFSEWKQVRTKELQYALDTFERFLGQSDGGICVGRSYGLALSPEGTDASIALLISACSECDGVCSVDCE